MKRTLCNLCEESVRFRTPTDCSPGCNLETTRHFSSLPHFSCRKCKNGEGHVHFCHFFNKAGTFGAGTASSTTSATKKEARKLREVGAVKGTSSSSSTPKKKQRNFEHFRRTQALLGTWLTSQALRVFQRRLNCTDLDFCLLTLTPKQDLSIDSTQDLNEATSQIVKLSYLSVHSSLFSLQVLVFIVS